VIYNPRVDGNVFNWILDAAQFVREVRQEEINAIKEAATKLKRLDRSEMAYQKW
jgi:uncharacterized membrane protein YjjP (DUF1212 family)